MRAQQQRGGWRRVGLLVGLGVFVAVVLLSGLGRLRGMENSLLGLGFELRGTRATAPQVVLLTIEEGGVQAGEAGPWSYRGLAELVERLDEADAAVIGLDLPALAGGLLPVPSPDADERLVDAMRAHGGVVLPAVMHEGAPTGGSAAGIEPYAIGEGTLRRPERLEPGHLVVPEAELIAAAAGIGTTNVYPDPDGATREAPLAVSWNGSIYPAFWVELARVLADLPPGGVVVEERALAMGDRRLSADAEMEVLINYVGGYQAFPRIPYRSAMELTPDELRRRVAGRIVVVGTDLAGVTALLRAPTAPPLMPGVEVAATITENLVAGTLLRRVPAWVSMLLALVLAGLAGRLVERASALHGLLITLTGLAAVAAVGLVLFMLGIHMRLALPLLTVAVTGAILVGRSAVRSDRRRARAEARLQSRLQAITGIGRLVNSSLDPEKLLVEILRWTESEIEAEACSLLLMEPDGEHLRFEVALGEKGDMLKDITLRVGEGLAGAAAKSGEPVVADDVASDERWSPDVAYAIDFETRSIACVPMMMRDECLGVIEIINKRGDVFTDYDLQLLQVISSQSALFLDNARLYRRLSERVDLADEELRRANDRLEEEMARIQTLVDEMADGVIATDEAGRVVIFNNAAERLFGVTADRVVGRPAATAIGQDEAAELFVMPLSPRGGSHATEITVTRHGREPVVLRAQIALIDQPGQDAVGKCAVFTDITHLKALDRMKMDLISFVSHELKNPIASLQGACRMLHDRVPTDDENTAELLEIVGRQGRRMQYLVQDFLDLSRIEAGQPLELDWARIEKPRELIEGAFELCRGVGGEHRLSAIVDDDLPPLWADRRKIEGVLVNLIENAAKYSPEGGDVTVTVSAGEGEIVIAVADQGIGIREEDLPKLFKSFQRIHDNSFGRVSGTGVGLYICKHIMQAQGGDITVESTWGEGSTFRLHIPQRSSPPEPGADGR